MTTTLATAVDPRPSVSLIRRGRGIKADIKSVSLGPAQAILKDFAGRPWPVRLLGRMQIAQEIRALARLRGLPGVPACYGRWGRDGVLLERLDGERITRWCQKRREEAPAMFDRLDRLVGAMHARGVIHLDLRARDNILIDGTGRPGIIDFNASLCFAVGEGAGARLTFRILRRVDTSALAKWKLRIAPGILAPAEARRHRRMALLRRLWIFS